MKPAPNFTAWPDAVSGEWKLELLRWLREQTGIEVLIETGTCEGVTPYRLRDEFKLIYTIELHDGLYQRSCDLLRPYDHIRCYHGSSRTILRNILKPGTDARILFWLDAHSSGPHTANDGDPLTDELLAITELCANALVVIDDMRSVNELRGQVHEVDLTGWHIEYRTGEIVLHQEGRYSIPEFEK